MMDPEPNIRNTSQADLDDILRINIAAFGQHEEAELVRDLLQDATAEPRVSLLALDGKTPVGHILFTRVRVANDGPASAILAPLAVLPGSQGKGFGGKLIRTGLEQLAKSGVCLVFVLGHPDYYPRYGFEPAGVLGFEAPYPIPAEHASAWMVQELRPGVISSTKGRISCADALNRPELWSE